MLEIKSIKQTNSIIFELKGRIDGLSTPELEKSFEARLLEGARKFIIDFTSVSYISSMGLRVFLSVQKKLKKIGGEIVLASMPDNIKGVFDTSGFSSIFSIFLSVDEAIKILPANGIKQKIETFDFIGKEVKFIRPGGKKGNLYPIGSTAKLQCAEYDFPDVITVNATALKHGTGIAAPGDSFSEYSNLFGESAFISGSFFNLPASSKPVVDFILKNEATEETKLNFLYGFQFDGDYNYIIGFDEQEQFYNLNDLIELAHAVSGFNLCGIVVIAESAGIMGMNLKKSPVKSNQTTQTTQSSIFSRENFADWVDLPFEHTHFNHLNISVGVSSREKPGNDNTMNLFFGEELPFHFHSVLFEKGFLNKDLFSFEMELYRIMHEFNPLIVQHLLGESQFKSGLLGIIELEAN